MCQPRPPKLITSKIKNAEALWRCAGPLLCPEGPQSENAQRARQFMWPEGPQSENAQQGGRIVPRRSTERKRSTKRKHCAPKVHRAPNAQQGGSIVPRRSTERITLNNGALRAATAGHWTSEASTGHQPCEPAGCFQNNAGSFPPQEDELCAPALISCVSK